MEFNVKCIRLYHEDIIFGEDIDKFFGNINGVFKTQWLRKKNLKNFMITISINITEVTDIYHNQIAEEDWIKYGVKKENFSDICYMSELPENQ